MDFSLLLSSYATVWSNPEVLLMTFIGALGGVLLGAIPGMTATMGVALLIPFSFGMDLIPSIGLLLGIVVAYIHNRFCETEFNNAFQIYGGTRFVFIVLIPVMVVLAVLFTFVWPYAQAGINAVSYTHLTLPTS